MMNPTNNKYKIIVFAPAQPLLVLKVQPSWKISYLQSHFYDNETRIFIFKGMVLLPSMTFSDCNIKENDAIIAVRNQADNFDFVLSHFQRISDDYENFQTRVNAATDNNLMHEVHRLSDLRLMRLDKRIHKCSFINDVYKHTDTVPLVIDENNIESPSTEALPICW
ncbi:hypothetical protein TRFO_26838 [Tritrichomonas foetus]|uniref:Ubiquitin-like domain-containing protein n=1 Tax=Tritrichomonas foetus TaxID=1144522 RepID=A0A1J4K6T1_9EUKA|nr:hypothetical protein TRFO_26838 [Tritrichomonas foetus]|eukprot:OHT05422.1 hypothetical protein TRFO_26838 [Tritrichomonas foetus]